MTARQGALAAGLVAALAVALLAFAGWPGPLYRDSDYMQYYAGSRALLEGASPYDHDWWAAFHERVGSQALSAPPRTGDPSVDWTTPYPLPTFVLLLPFAIFPLRLAEPLFAVVQGGLLLAAVALLGARVLPRARRDAPVAIALAVASQPFWVLVAGGNATGFAAAAFTFALVALVAGRPGRAGILLAGCLVKPHLFVLAGIALVLSARPDERRRVLGGAAVAGAIVASLAFALEPGWVGDWWREATRLQETSASNATGWTIARPFVTDFRPWSAAVVVGAALAPFLWWYRSRPAPLWLVGAAVPASVLVAPHGWSYDYVALAPTVVAGIAITASARRRVLALGALAVATVLAPWALYIVAFARNGEDLTAWLLLLGEAAIIMWAPRRRRAGSGGDREQRDDEDRHEPRPGVVVARER